MGARLVAVCPLALALMFWQNMPSPADRGELQRLERVWNAAHIRGDSEALGRLWADDLEVAVPKMPVMKKGELIKFVDSGRMKFQRYETSDLNIRVYGQSAVVTGRLLRKREITATRWMMTGTLQRCINTPPTAGESFLSTHPKPRLLKNRNRYVFAHPRLSQRIAAQSQLVRTAVTEYGGAA
jgi:hypothetical protein